MIGAAAETEAMQAPAASEPATAPTCVEGPAIVVTPPAAPTPEALAPDASPIVPTLAEGQAIAVTPPEVATPEAAPAPEAEAKPEEQAATENVAAVAAEAVVSDQGAPAVISDQAAPTAADEAPKMPPPPPAVQHRPTLLGATSQQLPVTVKVVKHSVQYLPPIRHPPTSLEKPMGTKDMGRYYIAVYTEEQQQRLNVDERGLPRSPAAAIAAAPPPIQVEVPDIEARDLDQQRGQEEEPMRVAHRRLFLCC
mmetsp:Transcript_39149/g.112574  ORF Transcript_39149/g.112574 Transcript_39149/m.112574 type:complete len:252 (-) Transcript_39149:147-902(-)